jgi:hypothetical protein
MQRAQLSAYVALAIVALFAAFTVYTRLHDGCHFHGGRRQGGWDCAHPASAAIPARP